MDREDYLFPAGTLAFAQQQLPKYCDTRDTRESWTPPRSYRHSFCSNNCYPVALQGIYAAVVDNDPTVNNEVEHKALCCEYAHTALSALLLMASLYHNVNGRTYPSASSRLFCLNTTIL